MKTMKIFLTLLLFVSFVVTSCKKDEEESAVAEGKMTSTIDGKSTQFTVSSFLYKQTYLSQSYEYLVVSGSSGTSQTNMSSFVVTVYASTIKAGTYTVPTYTDATTYDFFKGYAMGMYMPQLTSSSDYYYSYGIEKSSGSVTIKSVSSTNVQGSYNMVLVNTLDQTKTMTLKGDFNAKVMSLNMK